MATAFQEKKEEEKTEKIQTLLCSLSLIHALHNFTVFNSMPAVLSIQFNQLYCESLLVQNCETSKLRAKPKKSNPQVERILWFALSETGTGATFTKP